METTRSSTESVQTQSDYFHVSARVAAWLFAVAVLRNGGLDPVIEAPGRANSEGWFMSPFDLRLLIRVYPMFVLATSRDRWQALRAFLALALLLVESPLAAIFELSIVWMEAMKLACWLYRNEKEERRRSILQLFSFPFSAYVSLCHIFIIENLKNAENENNGGGLARAMTYLVYEAFQVGLVIEVALGALLHPIT